MYVRSIFIFFLSILIGWILREPSILSSERKLSGLNKYANFTYPSVEPNVSLHAWFWRPKNIQKKISSSCHGSWIGCSKRF